jgi:hypothetical protein
MVAMAFLEVEKPSKGRRDGCGMGEENVTGENYNQELIEVKEVQ